MKLFFSMCPKMCFRRSHTQIYLRWLLHMFFFSSKMTESDLAGTLVRPVSTLEHGSLCPLVLQKLNCLKQSLILPLPTAHSFSFPPVSNHRCLNKESNEFKIIFISMSEFSGWKLTYSITLWSFTLPMQKTGIKGDMTYDIYFYGIS